MCQSTMRKQLKCRVCALLPHAEAQQGRCNLQRLASLPCLDFHGHRAPPAGTELASLHSLHCNLFVLFVAQFLLLGRVYPLSSTFPCLCAQPQREKVIGARRPCPTGRNACMPCAAVLPSGAKIEDPPSPAQKRPCPTHEERRVHCMFSVQASRTGPQAPRGCSCWPAPATCSARPWRALALGEGRGAGCTVFGEGAGCNTLGEGEGCTVFGEDAGCNTLGEGEGCTVFGEDAGCKVFGEGEGCTVFGEGEGA